MSRYDWLLSLGTVGSDNCTIPFLSVQGISLDFFIQKLYPVQDGLSRETVVFQGTK